MSPKLKAFIDYGPLLAFLGAFYLSGKDSLIATGATMVASLIVLAIGYAIERRLAPMPLFTGLVVMVMGGITLLLGDPVFIQMKPTIIYSFFAVLLLGGMSRDKLFLEMIIGSQLELPKAAWRTLTVRFSVFFVFLAVLNEIIRHTVSFEAWLNFKVFGATALMFVFIATQGPMIMRHMPNPDDEADKTGST